MTLQAETVPYGSRDLSRSELQRLDVYMYCSPKLNETLTIVEPAGLALALEFEFAPEIEVFVVRPRTLCVWTSSLELSFWTRSCRGREQFHLLTAFPEGASGQARAAARQCEAILAAAREAQIALRLVPQVQLLRQAIENANRLRLLPYVQVASDLPTRAVLRERVLELFRYQARHSFSRLELALDTFTASDIRAVTCALIHEGQLRIDWSAKLHRHTMVEMGAAS